MTSTPEPQGTNISCPTPPMLEDALGYHGGARLVGFYWEQFGDELAWTDGRRSFVGASWFAWLTFIRHAIIAEHLAAYDFGSSDGSAKHWLILDRKDRQLSVAPVEEAKQILERQWPPAPPVEVPLVIDIESLNMALQEWINVPTDPATIQAAMQHELEQLRALETWLNSQQIRPQTAN